MSEESANDDDKSQVMVKIQLAEQQLNEVKGILTKDLSKEVIKDIGVDLDVINKHLKVLLSKK